MTRRNALILAVAARRALQRRSRAVAASRRRPTGSRSSSSRCCFVLAVGSDVLTVEVRGLRVSGCVPRDRAGDGSARTGARCGDRRRVGARSTRSSSRRLAGTRRSATSRRSRVFPLVGGLARSDSLRPGRPARTPSAFGFARSSCSWSSWSRTSSTSRSSPLPPRSAGGPRAERCVASVYLTVLPSEFATASCTAGVAFSYGRLGVGAVGLARGRAVRLPVPAARRRRRRTSAARSSQQRTRELASLQVGLLQHGHADAVDARRDDRAALRRGRALRARGRRACSGCREREQDLIHTAALLHDIGKFILPDSILFADRKLTDEEWEHGQAPPGAGRASSSSGSRATARSPRSSCSHHERFDGGGYPAGIAGEDDPARRAHHRRRPTPTT